ncbi:MAG TPA: hypothetical protein VMR31_03895 [Myxococcota bacterium]|nr:hypothetical protein [Myxococcota bacterium]
MEAPTCKGWAALKRDDRLVVVGTVLENKVGRPEKSKLAECLWGIYDQIADHTTELCAQGGSEYDQALGAALKSAIGFCKAP